MGNIDETLLPRVFARFLVDGRSDKRRAHKRRVVERSPCTHRVKQDTDDTNRVMGTRKSHEIRSKFFRSERSRAIATAASETSGVTTQGIAGSAKFGLQG